MKTLISVSSSAVPIVSGRNEVENSYFVFIPQEKHLQNCTQYDVLKYFEISSIRVT